MYASQMPADGLVTISEASRHVYYDLLAVGSKAKRFCRDVELYLVPHRWVRGRAQLYASNATGEGSDSACGLDASSYACYLAGGADGHSLKG